MTDSPPPASQAEDQNTGSELPIDKMILTQGSWILNADFPGPSGSFAASPGEGLYILDRSVKPFSAVRTPDCIRRDDREMFTMQLVLSGRECHQFGENSIVGAPGDIILYNWTRPAKFEVIERSRKIQVIMPLSRLKSWMPNHWQTVGGRLGAHEAGTDLLASFIRLIAPRHMAGNLPNGPALTESFLGLLVNVLEGKTQPVTLKQSHLEKVKRYIDEHLADPSLSIERICAAHRLSIRYLHALFESEGTTVQRYVYHARLLRCARELENPAMAGRQVIDIAFSWGFQNASHFSRRFKEEFGVSPTHFRRAALAHLSKL